MLWPCVISAMLVMAGCEESTGQTAAQPEGTVLQTLTLDVNNDGLPDRVELVTGELDADLLVFLSRKGETELEDKPSFTKKGIAFNGALEGQKATLEAAKGGTFIIQSLNEAVGRARWEKTLIVAFRKGEFIVAGMTYQERDTLDANAGGKCEVNFLTGRSLRDGKPYPEKHELLSLKDWEPDHLPKACEF